MAATLINRSSLSLLFLTLAAVIQTLQANVAVYDDYWKQKAAAARKATLNSYVPQPFNVTDQLNSKVGESCKVLDAGAKNRTNISTSTSSRRGLIIKKKGKRGGPCKATNPIDRCWRCDPNWANNRKKLADCALGFGRGTKGGRDGPIYVVTDASDADMVNPKPGTLRHAVIQKGPLWIIFARSMIIRLNQELIMEGDKTIDARGAQVRIAYGAGITLQFIKNVIIHGVRFHNIVQGSGGMIRDSVDHYGFRTASDGDAISIYGSSNIWIDHISVSNCHDGVVDAIMGSTAITISNSQFTNHNEVMLFGGSDSYSDDQLMQITVAFNHFGRGLVQRMPRCRWGFFHVVNNDYTHWEMYAIGGSANPTILSQGNRFTAPHNPHAKEVTKRSAELGTWKNWIWRSEGDLMRNGAFFTESGDAKVVKKFSRHDVIKFKPGTYVTRLTRYSGSLDCFVGKPC